METKGENMTNKYNGQWLVSWKEMQKGSKEPLPMRPFPDKELAEAYVVGCADVIQMMSKSDLEYQDIIKDFEITCVEGN